MDLKQQKALHVGLENIYAKMAEYNKLCVSSNMRVGMEKFHRVTCVKCLSELDACLLAVLTPLETIRTQMADSRTVLETVDVGPTSPPGTPAAPTVACPPRMPAMAEMRGLLGRMEGLLTEGETGRATAPRAQEGLVHVISHGQKVWNEGLGFVGPRYVCQKCAAN